ncbi:Thermonuclease precursor (TNase) (Micrococcal nuclease) (Staphylococcal nuclease) (modular protein) [Acetoanaerobium sticklandii]|uniref:Thermonuclease (TNase) (Micrococcal nuclease) (Staphylococcal nuclease) (Modular protein) n=1 Tax=Acetoanaerobium sticklandii (strain ATCC 12662 / DSM 519 / JCM 1433 / CCUG 9281 / NCIMB 10654 / HF) TaxID=499177 RepID=E3PSE1_ACESD|nr:thermonuclease family protein [Acetoanaerobium sticklandii]CBH21795.1 Thermonuclease precursor (TNase) (Micrococcal nuclease) (Staphylococcal nuclease) (modular protein) [Acetoanaerobium sticklandii]
MESLLSIIAIALFVYSMVNFFKLIKNRDKSYFKKALALFISSFIVVMLIPIAPVKSEEHQIPLNATEENKNSNEIVAEQTSNQEASKTEKTGAKLYTVTRTIDGDTIEVLIDGNTEKIRLIGIDTPESVHPDQSKNVPEGKMASEFTKSKLEGKQIALELDVEERDRYGRLLAYVWIDNVMFNKTLLSEGLAQVSTYPPNVKYTNDFLALEKQARENSVGLWSQQVATTAPVFSEPKPQASTVNNEMTFIGNRNTKKFHYPTCSSVNQMNESNKVSLSSREEAINGGFIPCKRCNP